MLGKVLIGLLVVAGLFVLYMLLSPAQAQAKSNSNSPANWRGYNRQLGNVVRNPIIAAFEKQQNTGPGHF